MGVLQQAIQICSEDVIKETLEKEKAERAAQNEGSSESTTPTVSQNVKERN